MIISIFNVYDQITPYKFKNFKKKNAILNIFKVSIKSLEIISSH